MIEQAIEFVVSSVHDPALSSADIPDAIRNKIIKNRSNIRKFRKVGDLHRYISRFSSSGTETESNN